MKRRRDKAGSGFQEPLPFPPACVDAAAEVGPPVTPSSPSPDDRILYHTSPGVKQDAVAQIRTRLTPSVLRELLRALRALNEPARSASTDAPEAHAGGPAGSKQAAVDACAPDSHPTSTDAEDPREARGVDTEPKGPGETSPEGEPPEFQEE